jgi:hypothetical protein
VLVPLAWQALLTWRCGRQHNTRPGPWPTLGGPSRSTEWRRPPRSRWPPQRRRDPAITEPQTSRHRHGCAGLGSGPWATLRPFARHHRSGNLPSPGISRRDRPDNCPPNRGPCSDHQRDHTIQPPGAKQGVGSEPANTAMARSAHSRFWVPSPAVQPSPGGRRYAAWRPLGPIRGSRFRRSIPTQ